LKNFKRNIQKLNNNREYRWKKSPVSANAFQGFKTKNENVVLIKSKAFWDSVY
jgi:hypothetical protein